MLSGGRFLHKEQSCLAVCKDGGRGVPPRGPRSPTPLNDGQALPSSCQTINLRRSEVSPAHTYCQRLCPKRQRSAAPHFQQPHSSLKKQSHSCCIIYSTAVSFSAGVSDGEQTGELLNIRCFSHCNSRFHSSSANRPLVNRQTGRKERGKKRFCFQLRLHTRNHNGSKTYYQSQDHQKTFQ